MNVQHLHNPRQRILFVTGILVVMAAVLAAQLVRWMVWPQPVEVGGPDIWQPRYDVTSQTVPRGNLVDRDGALLVTTTYQFKVSLTPMSLKAAGELQLKAGDLAGRLAPLLGMSEADVLARVTKPEEYGFTSEYAYLATVDFQTGQEITRRQRSSQDQKRKDPAENPDYGLPWGAVRLEPITVRVYPEGSLGAHVFGFVNHEPQAFYGIEKKHNDELRGQNTFDVTAGGIPLAKMGPRFQQNASTEGAHDLILTMDRAIQYLVEQELRATVQRFGAQGGTIIVLEPKTGGVLASASYPTYAPARYGEYPQATWNDPAISEQYEPGSIFKIITMAAGLNAGVVTPDTTYQDTGCVTIGGQRICNLDERIYGLSTMRDVLLHSLNTGTIFINGRLDKEFYAYVERFGFGALTEIDLAGEIAGDVRRPGDRNWSEADLGTNSYGQGLAVTPMQMASAVGAVANGGLLMKPHVVQGIIANERVLRIDPRPVRQVIRKETAQTLTDMLVHAVDNGAELARVPGYSVAGKSGTAQIPVETGYSPTETIAGFVGYLPAHDPAFVILVKIVRPRTEKLGNKVAAPAFKNIAQQLVAMAGIPPDRKPAER
jgi:cell division protein FtsI/penicillin-binding protein 2